jgi:hypothetical protein
VKRILVTGARDWMDKEAIIDALEAHGPGIVVQGGNGGVVALPSNREFTWGGKRYSFKKHQRIECGADYIAKVTAVALGWPVETHTPEWGKYGRKAGPLRNEKMVQSLHVENGDVCIAAPGTSSVGTWDTINRCIKRGIQVYFVEGAVIKPGFKQER